MTRRIAQAADRAHTTVHFPVCVLGPYGHLPRLDQYGTVIFVLEGIGLFRALPFMRHLVQESRSRRNTVRRLEIVWQVELKDFSTCPLVPDAVRSGAYQNRPSPHILGPGSYPLSTDIVVFLAYVED
jgi:hypothetical protein